MFGSFATVRTCDACNGTGKIIQETCPECRGRGRVNKSKRIVVNVPAGIDNGQTLNMRGEGEAGLRGGPAGDLYITITVKPHKLFTRRGTDLYLDMNIPMTVAALGGEIQVPTLRGTVKYTVPGRDPARHHLPSEGTGHAPVEFQLQGRFVGTHQCDHPQTVVG